MGKHLTYPERKRTGVEWFPTVPGSWDVLYARRIFKQVREAAKPDDEQLAATQKYGVIPQRLFMEYQDQKVVLALSGTGNFKHVEIDDFVISLRSFQGGIERCHYEGCVSPAYTVMRRTKPIEPTYFSYLLKSEGFITALQAVTQGIREGKTITFEQFGSISLPFPSHREQQQIAAFLDHETTKIDRLIARQERLIELLKEKRQAVISHAVTKGLNPDAQMKDSGVEWLGEVPAHWATTRLKHETTHIVDCLHSTPQYTEEGEYPAIRTADISPGKLYLPGARRVTENEYRERIARLELQPDDIVYSREGERFGMAAIVPEGARLCLGQRVMMFRAGAVTDPRFLMWGLNSTSTYRQAQQDVIGATSPHVNVETIRNFWLAHPPLGEQVQICDWIAETIGKLDFLVDKSEHSIELMKEHRTALISAAVTGKIDVRGWQKPNTEPQAAATAASA